MQAVLQQIVAHIKVLPKLLGRRWLLPTIVVALGVWVLIRLGYWQLDRLEQRRAFNAEVHAAWMQEPFDLNANELPEDVEPLAYRRIVVEGEFDYERQVVLTSQSRDGVAGVVLLTPLRLADGRAVLVARGWLPYNSAGREYWAQFPEPPGAPVIGLIQESQTPPNATPSADPRDEWFRVDIEGIEAQLPYDLMPAFILQLPEEGRSYSDLPSREEPLRLDEGNHFSYAIQWFTFAVVLAVGYVILVQQREERRRRIASGEAVAEPDPIPELEPIQHQGHAHS
jgi:surfeit locus 1 family protein